MPEKRGSTEGRDFTDNLGGGPTSRKPLTPKERDVMLDFLRENLANPTASLSQTRKDIREYVMGSVDQVPAINAKIASDILKREDPILAKDGPFIVTAAAAGNGPRLRELIMAATEGGEDLEQLRELLEAKDEQGRTPLMMAAAYGNHEVASVLIEQGAKVGLSLSQRDNNGRNVIDHLAAYDVSKFQEAQRRRGLYEEDYEMGQHSERLAQSARIMEAIQKSSATAGFLKNRLILSDKAQDINQDPNRQRQLLQLISGSSKADQEHLPPFYQAGQNSNFALLEQMLKTPGLNANKSLTVTTEGGNKIRTTPAEIALMKQDPSSLKLLVDSAGARSQSSLVYLMSGPNPKEGSLLHKAALMGHSSCLKALVGDAQGPAMRKVALLQDSERRNLLHCTAQHPSPYTAELLRALDPKTRSRAFDEQDKFGNTPVHYAAASIADPKVWESISSSGAMTKKNRDGATAFGVALASGNVAAVEGMAKSWAQQYDRGNPVQKFFMRIQMQQMIREPAVKGGNTVGELLAHDKSRMGKALEDVYHCSSSKSISYIKNKDTIPGLDAEAIARQTKTRLQISDTANKYTAPPAYELESKKTASPEKSVRDSVAQVRDSDSPSSALDIVAVKQVGTKERQR